MNTHRRSFLKCALLALFWLMAVTPLASDSGQSVSLTTLNWPPYYGKNLPKNGFIAEISRQAFQESGWTMEVTFLPWNRAMMMAKKGKFDGLLGAYYNEDRAENFLYTDHIAVSEETFIVPKGSSLTFTEGDSLDKMEFKTISALRGDAKVTALQEEGLTVEETNSDLQSLRKLKANRVDIAIISKHVYFSLIQENPDLQGHFRLLEKPFRTYRIYNAIRKEHPQAEGLVEDFNQGLLQLKEKGLYYDILEEFGMK